jgi:ribosomal protein S27AE
MERCKHSVYLATPPEVRTRLAFNCSFCNPEFDASFLRPRAQVRAEAENFNLPRAFGTMDSEKIRANKHDPYHCPECNSSIYTNEKEGWRCAECGHVRKAVRRG